MRLCFGSLLVLFITASPVLGVEPGGISGVINLDDATGVKTATLKLKQEGKVFKRGSNRERREF